MFLGDYLVGDTLEFKFTTRRFSTGAPFTLAGTPVLSVYEDAGTIEITAGITLTVDFDTRTGLNHVTIVATGANGYEAGKHYQVVITTGTVDAVSVVGEVVGFFTLERGAAFRRLGAPAGASVSADIAAVQADTDNLQTRTPAALVGGRMDSSVGAYAAGMTPTRPSASGTADSGSTTTVVDTERTEADTDYWKGCLIKFTSGTLNGQTRLVTAFDPATDTLTFAPALTVAAGTHTYELYPMGRVDLHLWLGTLVNAVILGRVDASVGAMAADVITAAAIAAGAIGSSEAPNLDAAVSSRLAPTVAGRTLDVTATGEAAIDLDNTVGTLGAAEIPNLDVAVSTRVATAGIKKNTAYSNFEFLMIDSADHLTPKTGLTDAGFTKQESIDGAAFVALTGVITEVGSGFYKINFTTGELNGDTISLRFAHAGADTRNITVRTST